MLSHDAKLRCDLVDLYYTLYGIKIPFCLPIPELLAITKPKKIGPPSPEVSLCDTCLFSFYIYFNTLIKLHAI